MRREGGGALVGEEAVGLEGNDGGGADGAVELLLGRLGGQHVLEGLVVRQVLRGQSQSASYRQVEKKG